MKSFPKNKRKPDKAFLLWQRKRECLCKEFGGCTGDIVPAHIFAGGMGMKCDDKDSVPLCFAHHIYDIGLERLGIEGFKEKYGIDVREVAKNNYREFKESKK